MTELFRCSACRRSLPREGFSKNRHTKSGLQNQCIECRRGSYSRYAEKQNATKRAYRIANLELVRANEKRSKSKPENKARQAERQRAYYVANRERIKDRVAIYAAENRDKMREWNRVYRSLHKDKVRANRENRRAAMASAPGRGVTEAEWIAILDSYECRCAYCIRQLADGEATMDHVLAIKSGGAHDPENVVPACQSCNSSKRNHDLHEWLWRVPRAQRAKQMAA